MRILPVACFISLLVSAPASAQESTPPEQATLEAPPAAASNAQLANVRIELTIVEQGAAAPSGSKTVTMLVEDRQSVRIRATRTAANSPNLNIDARPEIMREGRIRVSLSLEYAASAQPPIQASVTALLQDGKPLVVSEYPAGDRQVRVELKATVIK